MPVVSQDKQIRRAAFEQAFIEVLVRASGSSEVSRGLNIQSASQYVQQYRYLPLPEEADSAEPVMLLMTQPKHLLWVQFNRRLIKKLLGENALPVWGQQRPGVLLWIAVRDGGHRYILRDTDQSVIKDAVEKEAQRRGLPLIWPRHNDDNVLFTDIWGGFWESVFSASEQYDAAAILVGRMNWLKGGWRVDWTMQLANDSQSWRLHSVDLQRLMASGINVATDQISSRFAVLASGANTGQLSVQINGVNHLRAYVRASRYLASLAMVKNLYAAQVEQGSVRFNVDVSGDREDLQRIIALGEVLVADAPQQILQTPAADNASSLRPFTDDNILTYRFSP